MNLNKAGIHEGGETILRKSKPKQCRKLQLPGRLLVVVCLAVLSGCLAPHGSGRGLLVKPGGARLNLVSGAAPPLPELPVEITGESTHAETPGKGRGARVEDPEIDDILNIPQDLQPFSRGVGADAVSPACRQKQLERYQASQFAPWTAKSTLFDCDMAAASMREMATGVWFGENRRHIDIKILNALLDRCDLDHFPSQNRPAVAVGSASLRLLPTMKPFYKNSMTPSGDMSPTELSFDRLQNTEIKVNEPLRLLHVSSDGAWAYVEASFAGGWVESSSVRLIDEPTIKRFMALPKVVVVRESALLVDHATEASSQPKIGALLPVIREMGDRYLVLVACNPGTPQAHLHHVTIDKGAVRPFPLDFSAENVALIGGELLGRPYGWGDAYHDRDCSGTTRDFFLPFGIWLPRNSREQIGAGPKISFDGLSPAGKEELIRSRAHPFLTLIHMEGHIMLYSGLYEQRPTIFHNVWGINYRDERGETSKRIIGKSVITSLEPGKELPRVGRTFLERFTGMRVLTDGCEAE